MNSTGRILSLFFATTTSLSPAMHITEIKKPNFVAFLSTDLTVIGGAKGCILYDIITKTSTVLTSKKIFNITAHPQGHMLALRLLRDQHITFFNTKTKNETWKADSTDQDIIFSSHNNFLYGQGIFDNFTLYNYDNKEIYKQEVSISYVDGISSPMKCHPTKDEIATPKRTYFSIAQPGYTPRIKTRLIPDRHYFCLGCEYSSDGCALAVKLSYFSKIFYCIYNTHTHSKLIYEIAEGIDAAFHPRCNLLALLSSDNLIELYNYETRQLVAKTFALSPTNLDSQRRSKRLAFCPNGKKIIAALENECLVLDVPQDNLFNTYYALRTQKLPKELIATILQLMNRQFTYVNFLQLSKIKLLEKCPVQPENEAITTKQQETEEIHITCVRKE